MLRTVQLAGAIAVGAILSMSVLAACGGDDDSGSQATQAQSSSAQAIDEIDETSAGLDQALAQLRDGDPKAAKETVAETYLQHFEEVEAPLEKVDAELKEKLEEGISTDLRGDIGKASANEISAHVKQLKADLATAKGKLEG
jgi:DNA anti-recombination protein RmuC